MVWEEVDGSTQQDLHLLQFVSVTVPGHPHFLSSSNAAIATSDLNVAPFERFVVKTQPILVLRLRSHISRRRSKGVENPARLHMVHLILTTSTNSFTARYYEDDYTYCGMVTTTRPPHHVVRDHSSKHVPVSHF